MSSLTDWLPALRELRRYDVRRDLGADVIAGLTVAVMLVPQAMAYAMLAGLPPVVGLYASIAPLLAYALLGTSRQLAVGPVAMDSLLVAAAVGAIAQTGSPHYLSLAVTLAAMVGVIQIAMGALRLGRLAKLLSPPVLVGFTGAAALIIALSQLSHLTGASIERSAQLHTLLSSALGHIGEVRALPLCIGGLSVAAIVGLKRWRRRFPGALAVVVIGGGLSAALSLSDAGLAVIGAVPAGLPTLSLTVPRLADVLALAPMALAIALVAFTEALGVGEVFARKNGYALEPNRELVALGVANLAAYVSGGYPVTGGLSRTAISAQAGARTRVAGVVTAIAIALSVALLTPLFAPLPKAVLAAIVVAAVAGLFDLEGMRRIAKTDRGDLLVLVITMGVTLFVGIPQGVLAGVLASLARERLGRSRARVAVEPVLLEPTPERRA